MCAHCDGAVGQLPREVTFTTPADLLVYLAEQDIEIGRKTEIEVLAAKVVELGRAHGIASPVNETMLRLIHVLERFPGSD